MSSFFESSNIVLFVSITLMVAWFIVFGYKFFDNVKKDPSAEYSQPTTASTLGVLFTFIGIAYGLLEFDANQIEKSVPSLLAGMKTAFFTSILGMAMSLLMKSYQGKMIRKNANSSEISEDANIATLIKYLQGSEEERLNQIKNIIDVSKENNEILKDSISESIQKMTNSLVGDGESTIIGQMKFLRGESNDNWKLLREEIKENNQALIDSFNNFAKQMAENNSKAFIEALNETMKDFNNKLQEQFGENFKQLNIAVGKLLDWQEHYKETVETTTNNQKEIFKGIDGARQSIESIDKSFASVQQTTEELQKLIVTAAAYEERIKAALEDLDTLSSKAQEYIPSTDTLLNKTLDSMKTTSEESISHVKEVSGALDEYSRNAQEKMSSAMEDTLKLTERTLNGISENSNALTDQSSETIKELREQLDNAISIIKQIGTSIEDISQEAHNNMQNSLNNFENTLSDVNASFADNLENILKDNSKTLDKARMELNAHISRSVDEAINSMEDISTNFHDACINQSNSITKASQDTETAIRSAADKLHQSALEVTTKASEDIQNLVRQNNENLKQASQNLSKDLDQKINGSLESFGLAMARVSQKFASDYTPLADKLRDVVQLAQNIDIRRRS